MRLSRKLCENLDLLKDQLGVGITFDAVVREFVIAGKPAAMIFLDGFIKDTLTADVMRRLQRVERSEIVPGIVEKLVTEQIAHVEVETVEATEDLVDQVLAGQLGLLIDGETEAIVLDVRTYPIRSIEEPELERVTRGSRDGFVETLVFNTALIRRRVRDSGLRFELLQVGSRSKTDVVLGYISDIADPERVKGLKARIEAVDMDALVMGSKSLEELLFPRSLNPLPQVRYTERPDVAAAHLYEGHIIILTDTTPMAMIVPVTFFHFTQHAEEYFQAPVVGTYLRWVRTLALFLALFLTPLWLSLYKHKAALPEFLQFIGPRESSTVPVALQFFILEVGVDLIRMALIHTPGSLATSLGIVGAILLGDLAVEVGLFVPETILYTAVMAICYFAIPSIEFALAIRTFRYLLLLAVTLFGFPGLLVGAVGVFLVIAQTDSLGVPYMWPLAPFASGPFFRLIMRYPVPQVRYRPVFAGGKDKDVR
ncbi:MAG: spore germination protein [Limnochordia bacterium]